MIVYVWCYFYGYQLSAQEEGKVILSPGHMGPKAFPVPKIGQVKVGKQNIIAIGVESHIEPSHEFSLNPKVDFFIPWGRRVALKVFTEPFEYYQTSESLRRKRFAKNKEGFAKGDIYFGALFTLFHRPEQQFYLVFNFQTKTTSGKKLEDARHFNAPAYVFDLTFQKDVRSPFLGARLSFFGYLSFLAWQSQFNQQNDAVGLALKAEAHWNTVRFGLEYGAYWGWQQTKDQPMVFRFESLWPIGQMDLFLRYTSGLRDQIAHAVALGTLIRL